MNRLLFYSGLCVCLTNQILTSQITAQSPAEHLNTTQKAASTNKKPQPKQVVFDVVSIKPVEKPDSRNFGGAQPAPTPDGYEGVKAQSLWSTIMLAYYQYNHSPLYWKRNMLLGVPPWLMKNQYSIYAKVSPEDVEEWQKPDPEGNRLHEALQAMLRDRCKLVIHHTTVEMPVYALMIKRGAKLKLQEASPNEVIPASAERIAYDGASEDIDPEHTTTRFYAMSIGYVVAHMMKDRPVIDMTGLKGRYNFVLQRVDDNTQNIPTENWDMESVGLTLRAMKAPVEVLVIDHIEEPSPN